MPIQCEFYALEGVSQLMNTMRLVRDNLNEKLVVEGVLMTMYDSRTKLSEQVVAEVRKAFGEQVYKTLIPRNVRLSEAPSYGQPIQVYDERSRGAEVYQELAKEVISRGSK
jgi:chromosome partitioning protein